MQVKSKQGKSGSAKPELAGSSSQAAAKSRGKQAAGARGREEAQRGDAELHHRLRLRNTQLSDYTALKEIMDLVYGHAGGAWSQEQFESQLVRFPEGQICLEDKGRVIAAVISVIVDYKKFGDFHTHQEITGNGYLTTHDPTGDTLYGVDVFVHPDYRGLRLGRRLYDARKELCRKLNLRRIIFGGRIPGYDKYIGKLTPQQYIDEVRTGS